MGIAKAIYISYITKLYINTQLAQAGGSGQACTLSSCLLISDEYRGGVRQRALSASKARWERTYSYLPHCRMYMHQNPLHFKTTFPFSLLRYYRLGREWSLRSSDEACPLVYLCWAWWPHLRLWEMPWPRALWILLRLSDTHTARKNWMHALLNHGIHVTALMRNIQI